MSESESNHPSGAPNGPPDRGAPGQSRTLPLPGVAAIALWMLASSAIAAYGVISRNLPPLFLIFSALLAAAGLGLVQLRRWGWALTLAAAFLSMSYELVLVVRLGQYPAGVMAFLNLIFFLYLIRPEVRSSLR